MPSSLLQSTRSVLEHPIPAAAAAALAVRPAADEHDPYYSAYIDQLPPGDYFGSMREQAATVADLFGAFTAAQADFAYASGKWTIKEVLGHLIDVERVFTYRATSFSRQDPSALPGYSQDDWIGPAEYSRRELADLVTEWSVVRAATIVFAAGLPADAPLRRGTASGRVFSVRALLHISPGHVNYHLAHVRERYMGAAAWPA